MASSGFRVDTDALQQVAGQLAKAAMDWTVVQADFGKGSAVDTAALGDPSVGSAWAGFAAAWSAELQDTEDALSELTTKTESTARGYAAAEARSTEQMRLR